MNPLLIVRVCTHHITSWRREKPCSGCHSIFLKHLLIFNYAQSMRRKKHVTPSIFSFPKKIRSKPIWQSYKTKGFLPFYKSLPEGTNRFLLIFYSALKYPKRWDGWRFLFLSTPSRNTSLHFMAFACIDTRPIMPHNPIGFIDENLRA